MFSFYRNYKRLLIQRIKKTKELQKINKDIEKEIINNSIRSIAKKKAIIYKKPINYILMENNSTKYINLILNKFQRNFGIKPRIGIELEFYLFSKNNNIKSFLQIIKNEFNERNLNIDKIEEEEGNGQYEIQSGIYDDLFLAIKEIKTAKEIVESLAIKENIIASFSGKPNTRDSSSTMQLNISFIDERGKNVFARNIIDGKLQEGEFLLNAVAGLCANLNSSLLCFVKDENCMSIFNLELNSYLDSICKASSPSFVCWGVNNRTAPIRIPVPDFISKEQYENEDKNNRRIEFRGISANANIEMAILAILINIYDGIVNKMTPPEKNSYNTIITNEDLKPIVSNLNIARMEFDINLDIIF